MEWVIETLRVLREVRDWTGRRSLNGTRSTATREAIQRATEAAEVAAGEAIVVERLGPAKPAKSRRERPTAEDKPDPRGPKIPLSKIDPHAVSVLRRLKRHKHKAYLVGGCVRDLLLDLEPKDFDIATDAKPEEVKAIFRNSRIIGRRFRLVHLYFRGGHIIEVATFRANVTQDDEDSDDLLIRRDNVFGSEKEDAFRRDFTINGLFYDVTTGRVIDHVGGLKDVERRYLKMIGDPDIRLREDPIRILRAIRFKAKVNVELDPELLASIIDCKEEILRCAPARILEESMRMLRIGHAKETVRLMAQTDVLGTLLPIIQEFIEKEGTVGVDVAVAGEEPKIVQWERLDLVLAHMHWLDEAIRAGVEVTDAVALGALAAAPLNEALDEIEEAGGDRNRAVSTWLTELGQRITLTKRMHEQLRQIFMAQRHLTRRTANNKRRRRRISPQVLMRRGFFKDALLLFEIQVRACEQPIDEVDHWRRLERGAKPPRRDDEDGDDGDDRPRKRRRRRGGRRRRKPAES